MAAVSVNRSILKDCSVVCLEAEEAIFVNLLTEKSSEFLGINYWLKAMPFFHQKTIYILITIMMAGGFWLFCRLWHRMTQSGEVIAMLMLQID